MRGVGMGKRKRGVVDIPAEMKLELGKNDWFKSFCDAAEACNIDVLKDLIEDLSADSIRLDNLANNNYSPMHWSILYNLPLEIYRLIAEKNICYVNAYDCFKKTPLHYSVAYSMLEASDFLLENGADKDSTDLFGKKPVSDSLNVKIRELLNSWDDMRDGDMQVDELQETVKKKLKIYNSPVGIDDSSLLGYDSGDEHTQE